ncbi:magnesium transporter CorA family protein [Sphingomonas sp. BN140010]|uniref:Magnesium transporter CorA family protein n=1 Tax=Sphingomonas arvum TaxID=2992113 RepID=A0ABT3JG36_9SPHN|nr:magnesium transporter CorA family protein [Sphingomonas sp. BN140010]MCW3798051.1 magnesium transporter CorA family protein [Sphingomonas sp. BN140010]
MLRTYGPSCDGSLLDAGHGPISPTATWIDLEEPTREEDKLVEQLLGLAVPTRDDLAEIEPSSRLYERDGALYMTLSTLRGVEEGQPTAEPIGFVLAGNRLVTIRYASPKPVRAFAAHVRREPERARDALSVLVGLVDAIVDRLADELEAAGAEMDTISSNIFAKSADERRIPAQQLTAMLTRIGRAQSLLARIRETTLSTVRFLSFLMGSARLHETDCTGSRNHLGSLQTDAAALLDHAGYLSDNMTFLLDASLGLISVEQNAAMKLFSWAALVFLPPTLIAGIFGMNFHHMPELDEPWGYPMALALMFLSAVLPLWYLKRRGWI